MMRSPDYDRSRAAYRETQTRHEEMQRIEATLEELAQLFNEVCRQIQRLHQMVLTLSPDGGSRRAGR